MGEIKILFHQQELKMVDQEEVVVVLEVVISLEQLDQVIHRQYLHHKVIMVELQQVIMEFKMQWRWRSNISWCKCCYIRCW